MSAVLDALDIVEDAAVSAGFPPMSDWWKETLRSFYTSARRQSVLRVGRRGGKSTSLCRVAVAEAIGGEHVIPPGDVAIVAIVSVTRDEANQRLRTIKALLDAVHVGYRPIDNGIELLTKPIAFKVFAASVAGVSGFTCICAICDEVAKWREGDSDRNPATEVLASLRPTLAGQEHARIFLSSSPLTIDDAHALAFDAGNTDFQRVYFAQTWIARPTLTEGECRELEPDDRLWRREYAGIPGIGVSDAFAAADVQGMVRTIRAAPLGSYMAVLDSSSGRSDGFSFALARYVNENGRRVVSIERVGCFEGAFAEAIDFDSIVAHVAHLARSNGAARVAGDQYMAYALTSSFASHGIAYVERPWTAPTKVEACSTLRRLLREKAIAVEDTEEGRAMARELLGLREILTAQKTFTIQARRTGAGHGDRAALAMLVARLVSEGDLLGASPPVDTNALSPAARLQRDNVARRAAIRTSWSDDPSYGREPDWRYPEKDVGQQFRISAPGEPARFTGANGNRPPRTGRGWTQW